MYLQEQYKFLFKEIHFTIDNYFSQVTLKNGINDYCEISDEECFIQVGKRLAGY